MMAESYNIFFYSSVVCCWNKNDCVKCVQPNRGKKINNNEATFSLLLIDTGNIIFNLKRLINGKLFAYIFIVFMLFR